MGNEHRLPACYFEKSLTRLQGTQALGLKPASRVMIVMQYNIYSASAIVVPLSRPQLLRGLQLVSTSPQLLCLLSALVQLPACRLGRHQFSQVLSCLDGDSPMSDQSSLGRLLEGPAEEKTLHSQCI